MKDDRLYFYSNTPPACCGVRRRNVDLIHIWECIQRIESYASEGKSAFAASNMMQDAIIRNFEIIGEATKHLSLELRQSHPEIQ